MSWEYGFVCKYCGKGFGNNPDKLAVHIAKKCKEIRHTA